MQSQETQPTPRARQKQKKILLVVAALLIIAAGSLAAWLYGQNQAAKDAAEPGQVQILNDGFSPATMKVTKGSVVRWINEDTAAHRILGDDPDTIIDSDEDLNHADDYQLVFDQPGTYTYHDPLNPNNHKGTIVVE